MQVPNPRSGAANALVSLVLPAYNAARRAERTWDEIRGFLRRAPGEWEVLFVCDGCTDGTADLLQRLTEPEAGRVRVLAPPRNRGNGHAGRPGLAAAP